MPNIIHIGLFGILLTGMLIGHQLGFEWAGGDGYGQETAVIETIDGGAMIDRAGVLSRANPTITLKRGEILQTEPLSRAVVRIGMHQIALDERTRLEVKNLTSGAIALRILDGTALVHTTQPYKLDATLSVATILNTAIANSDQHREDTFVIPYQKPVTITLESPPYANTENESNRSIPVSPHSHALFCEAPYDAADPRLNAFAVWARTLMD